MRGMIILAAFLGLSGGLFGAFAYGQLFGQAEAGGPRVKREAEITITQQDIHYHPGEKWRDVKGEYGGIYRVPIDGSRYRRAAFHLEMSGSHTTTPGTHCLRIAEVRGETRVPVPESEACVSGKVPFFVQSQRFSLPNGSHTYTLQEKAVGTSVLKVTMVRLVAEWPVK